MADHSAIEWTDATWGPVVGCTKVSPGCDNCYAERFVNRFAGIPAFPNRFDTVTLRPEFLELPLRWRKPRRVFVNSMADLFHDDVPDSYVAEVFAVMYRAPRHTFQVLTKRHGRMRSWLRGCRQWDGYITHNGNPPSSYGGDGIIVGVPERWPLPNVWLGVSVEDQKWADIRIPALLDTPSVVRWISAEPLLGPVDIAHYLSADGCHTFPDGEAFPNLCLSPSCGTALSWVVVGGESGPGARPMHPDWARSLRDQCTAARVPYLFKQHGEWTPNRPDNWRDYRASRVRTWLPDGTDYKPTEPDMLLDPAMVTTYRTGKHAAGRELDGRTWDQYPQAVTADA